MRWLAIFVLLFACSRGEGPPNDTGTYIDPPDDTGDVSPPPHFDPTPALQDFACASGSECAAEGPFIGDTCCAYGSGLEHLTTGSAAEAVDVVVDHGLAVLCGGFGARVNDVSDPAAPNRLGVAGSRCQHAAFGATTDTGGQVFYTAHHGDSWVASPSLQTWVVADDSVQAISSELDADVLFEDLAWQDGRLFVAAHAAGVRVYTTDGTGAPTYEQTLPLSDAQRLTIEQDRLYVVDDQRIVVFDIADPSNPSELGSFGLQAVGRALDAEGDHLYVAAGSGGLQVFDVGDPSAAVLTHHLTPPGSLMGVSVDGGLVATANWNHVELRRASDLLLLASRKTRVYSAFEQDFSVQLRDGDVYVAEWEALRMLRYQPGYVGPHAWTSTEILDFWGDQPASTIVGVQNRGPLPLTIERVHSSDEGSFWSDDTDVVVAPGEFGALTVHWQPDDAGSGFIELLTDDPDEEQDPLFIPVYSADGDRLKVGDKLTDDFAFLDPTCPPPQTGCTPDVNNLQGHVTVLAYFALF